MGLYSNYGPNDDVSISLDKLSRIERHQQNIQANIEEEVKEDHFRFYGKFKGLNEEFDFDDAYEHAVEQKVVAIQSAQQAKNETVRIEEQAKQTIVTAKAQAEAMTIQSEALSKNKGYRFSA